IKHGLVAGSTVKALKVLGAPIPDYPELVPASTWGDALVESPVGRELLYGTHPPLNYRVVYKCSNYFPNVPGATLLTTPENIGNVNTICAPNPAVDADGDYIDGPYESACGLCQPGSIAFACIGEDEMCIGVAMYWEIPRLGSDRNEEAVENMQNADELEDLNEVGTPGNLGILGYPPDITGNCPDCDGPGL
ncbi:MAG: hypothetical protein ACREQY_18215, partial [Candidatus Binatia bacterium]